MNSTETQTKEENLLYPLHMAAANGDIDKIKMLLAADYDIDATDKYNSTPLHVAAFHGQTETITFLLDQGANIEQKCYEGESPLHIAVYERQLPAIQTLLQHGANPESSDDYQMTPTLQILKNLLQQVETFETQKPEPPPETFYESLEILTTLTAHMDGPPVMETGFMNTSTTAPINCILENQATYAPNETIRNALLQTAEKINENDPFNIMGKFLEAKALLHTFPQSDIYALHFSNDKSINIHAEGHLRYYTTTLARDSLKAYCETLELDTHNIVTQTFESIANILEYSTMLASQSGDFATSENAEIKFDAGDLILLPTGWNGHFVDVILSKPNNTLIVCNAGWRFTEDPSGAKFYNIHYPENIDAHFIHDILMNKEQYNLEYQNAYHLGLEETFTLDFPAQSYDNCAWYTHQVAIETLIYLGVIEHGIDPENALAITEALYNVWEEFHADYMLQSYLSNSPSLETKALIDILWDHDNLDDPHVFNRATLLVDTLNSEEHVDTFTDYFQQNKSFTLIFEPVFEKCGMDVEKILEGFNESSNENIDDLSIPLSDEALQDLLSEILKINDFIDETDEITGLPPQDTALHTIDSPIDTITPDMILPPTEYEAVEMFQPQHDEFVL